MRRGWGSGEKGIQQTLDPVARERPSSRGLRCLGDFAGDRLLSAGLGGLARRRASGPRATRVADISRVNAVPWGNLESGWETPGRAWDR